MLDLDVDSLLNGDGISSVVATCAVVLVPALLIWSAVSKQSKVVAALAQLSGVQQRDEMREQIAAQAVEVDRLWFMLGVGNLAFSSYIIGAFPVLYFLYYSPKVAALILLRAVKFYRKKQHLLLFDFCYWANFLCLFYCWCMPKSPVLFQVIFVVANGPLAWSVLAFNHAMIFHSYAHVTSVVIHFSPLLLTYGLRWYASPVGETLGSSHFRVCVLDSCSQPTLLSLVGGALVYFYLWWLILYYLWIFVAMGSYIERKGYQTLWDRILQMKPVGPMLQGLLQRFPKLLVQLVYLLIHLTFSTLTMTVAAFLWHSQLAHFVFIVVLGGATVKNAAVFYFEIFKSQYAAASGIADTTPGTSVNTTKQLLSASGALAEAKQSLQQNLLTKA